MGCASGILGVFISVGDELPFCFVSQFGVKCVHLEVLIAPLSLNFFLGFVRSMFL